MEKTLTFIVEDALLSPIGFAILSGAGLMEAGASAPIYVHVSSMTHVGADGVLDLVANDIIKTGETVDEKSPIFVMEVKEGSMTKKLSATLDSSTKNKITVTGLSSDSDVFVDFYVARKQAATELTIDMKNFAGYYYVEASTLFRRQSTGEDLPAELIFPNVKVQSNFTFSMAPTGDPSTFTFTMDAMPGYTRFDRNKKVLCAIQIMDDASASENTGDDSVGNKADAEAIYPLEGN